MMEIFRTEIKILELSFVLSYEIKIKIVNLIRTSTVLCIILFLSDLKFECLERFPINLTNFLISDRLMHNRVK